MEPISTIISGIFINILTKFLESLFDLRKQLILRKLPSQRTEGKKGLILLVSNEASAMFAINHHLELIEPEGLPERILERIWLIPSNDKQADRFGAGTVRLVGKIIQKCMILVKESKVSSLEITLNGEVWLVAENELRWTSENLSLSLANSEKASLENNSVVQIKISNISSDAIQSNANKSLKPLKIIVENTVSPGDSQDTYMLVHQIFRKSGYKPNDIIADFTGGTKPMSFGMIMACLSAERQLQYVSFNPETKEMKGPFVIDSYQYGLFDLKEK
jgi:hypothetical protein